MAKTKYDFIIELLEEKKLNTVQKERILKLAAQEIRSEHTVDEIVLNRIEELEKKLNELKPPSVNENHTPRQTVDALRLFDTKLKYFTHKWDREEEFDRESEIAKAKEIIEHIKVPAQLHQRIKNFITKNYNKKENDDPEWYFHYDLGKTFKSYYSWDNEKFITWFNSSISKDITAPEINNNMIAPFKRSIQIRDNQLKDHIEPLVDQVSKELQVDEYLNLDKAKFYTNTQELMRGIKRILEEILNHARRNDRYRLKIEYRDDDRSLRIVHKKSRCLYASTNPDLFGGSFKGIMENFFLSICNWSIESHFADNTNRRINILTDQPDVLRVQDLDTEPEGFTHILYFY